MNNPEHPLSWRALGRIVLVGLSLYLAWRLHATILLIFVSIMLAAAFFPIVLKLEEKRLSVTLSSIFVVISLLLPIFIIIFTVLPGLIQQFPEIVKAVEKAVNQSALLPPAIKQIDLTQYAQNGVNYALESTSRITTFLTTFFTVIFLTLYFLIDSKRLLNLILTLIPEDNRKKVQKLTDDLAKINGQYIRGNLIISLVCGISIFIGLFLIGVPYAAPLALFAALVDMLPQIGAVIGAIPAIIIAFSVNPTAGILTIVLFIIYQQIENNILSPSVYNKALNLSPALSFIAVLVGASLAGIVGAFIALPIAASIPTIIKFIQESRSEKSNENTIPREDEKPPKNPILLAQQKPTHPNRKSPDS